MKKRILLIDDCKELVLSVKLFFKRRTVFICSASNLNDIEDIITDNKINILLLDNRLKHENSLNKLSLIRKDFPDLVIIFMTAFPSTDIAASCIKFGADDYLEKPFDLVNLEGKIDENIKRRDIRKKANQIKEQLIKLNTFSETLVTIKERINNFLAAISIAVDFIYEQHEIKNYISENEEKCFRYMKKGIKNISEFLDELEKIKKIDEIEYFEGLKMIKLHNR